MKQFERITLAVVSVVIFGLLWKHHTVANQTLTLAAAGAMSLGTCIASFQSNPKLPWAILISLLLIVIALVFAY